MGIKREQLAEVFGLRPEQIPAGRYKIAALFKLIAELKREQRMTWEDYPPD